MGKTNLRQLVRTHGTWKTGLEHDWSKIEHFKKLKFLQFGVNFGHFQWVLILIYVFKNGSNTVSDEISWV